MHRKYEMTSAQKKKSHEYEVTDAQKKKIDAYEPMDSQKTREYETTGAQNKTHAYKLMDSHSDCGRDHRVECYNYTDCGITEVNIPIPPNVEEIAEGSKSSIVWRNIPNFYFEEIKLFLG